MHFQESPAIDTRYAVHFTVGGDDEEDLGDSGYVTTLPEQSYSSLSDPEYANLSGYSVNSALTSDECEGMDGAASRDSDYLV